jgi:adenylosuccinate lyase/3-carboxy-cis,cis-muconate cycloisomerase
VGTTLDCELLRDLFGTEEIRSAFDSRALVQAWLDVERALAEAESEVGIVPPAAAERIAREADARLYELSTLREEVAATQHPLVPLLRALTERCGEFGGWVHWGATTQDITDTGLVLQVRAAVQPVRRDLARARAAAARLAVEHRATPMAGRTHGQHAVPITFGLKAASWADELARCEARLEAAASELPGQLAGAAGTLASLGADARAVRAAFCKRLGLAEPEVPWHAARDRVRDLTHALAETAAVGERIASEIVRLQATELAELAEPCAPGHVGSSTMPQKINPMTSEYLAAGARLLRGSVWALDASSAHASERDMAAWAVEWLAVPQAFILAAGLSDKLAHVLEGLEVDAARMRENLELTRGGILAEAAMMALAGHVGHARAHELVAAASRKAALSGASLADALAGDPEVAEHLDADELAAVLVPDAYLGLAPAVADASGRGGGRK